MSILSFFPFAYQQHHRLLTLGFPQRNPPQVSGPHGRQEPVQLVVDRLEAEEAMSRDFKYTVLLLADSAGIAAKDMMGKLLSVALTRPDGSRRHFTGHVFEFELQKKDDRVAHYRAVLRPWLWFLTLRRNNRLFLDRTLRDQTAAILAGYGALARWHWQMQGADPPSTMAVQGAGQGETDHNYLHRRWEAAGLVYWYEHTEQGHTLMLSDRSTPAPPIDGASPVIRFCAQSSSREENAISRWCSARELVSSHYQLSAHDFKHPRPRRTEMPTLNRQGELPVLEVSEYCGAYGFRKEDPGGEALARLRMEEIEAVAKRHEADSDNHFVQPGRCFELPDHFSTQARASAERSYLVLEVHHTATNNYLQASGGEAGYRNRFVATRESVPWRPGRGWNSRPLRVSAPQTATVVGQDGIGSLDVDEYGRVLIRYHWDQEEHKSARVRVSGAWAGGENGWASWPRVGSEVLVHHLDGNADHPVILGAVFNGEHMPPWKMPAQKALTGLRSRELSGDGGNAPGGHSNYILADDTAGQLQVKLRSDTQASEITLGHNVRIDATAGRTDPRGSGLEARTDGHGALRAAQGLLVSTEARPNARAHMTDMGETLARLAQGRDLHQALSEAAQHVQAHEPGDQDEVTRALQAQNDTLQGHGGSATQGGFTEFQAPHLTLASAAGIQATAQGSTHLASKEHTAVSSEGHISLGAGRSLLVSVKEAVRLFAYKAGMKLVAASADVDITALQKSVNILARLDITQTANKISLSAREEIVVNGGGSYTRWGAAGITSGTQAAWQVHAASHAAVGPDSLSPRNPSLPVPADLDLPQPGPQSLRFAAAGSDALMADAGYDGLPYSIFDAAGRVLLSGTVPPDGRIPRVHTEQRQLLMLQIGWPAARLEAAPPPPPGPAAQAEDLPGEAAEDDEAQRPDPPPVEAVDAGPPTSTVLDHPYDAELRSAFAEQHSHQFLPSTLVAELIARSLPTP
ncbi:type VI secretion system Vgr family protein [Eleftheria terrae]|uniref:type VI secretion system Vgr family protein n=1 Tax=Eleftheria terrae TaxID=1597781 RepID=UPI00263BBD96|nr:type VI secretion system Vgr family protein [Eleftheria terrae]WKB54698.1 type VI secretion system tip protein VgrG [Eleftheria terrae]